MSKEMIARCTNTNVDKQNRLKKSLFALGRAAFDPAGLSSPARLLVSDSFLFRFFVEEIVRPSITSKLFIVDRGDPWWTDVVCEMYDTLTNERCHVPEMPVKDIIGRRYLAAIDGRVFMFFDSCHRCFVFDIDADLWSELPPMRQRMTTLSVAAICGPGDGRRIYVIGRPITDELYTPTCRSRKADKEVISNMATEVFDIRANAWLPSGSVPSNPSGYFYSFISVVVDRRIYCIQADGQGGIEHQSNTEVLDVDSNTWIHLAPMPIGCHAILPVVIGRHIWCFCVYSYRTRCNVIMVYDIDRNEWTQCDNGHPVCSHSFAVMVGGKVWFVSKRILSHMSGSPGDMAGIIIYDPERCMWSGDFRTNIDECGGGICITAV